MKIVLLHTQGNWGYCSSECPMEEGCQCIFPFTLYGIKHDACTLQETPNGKPWCSVKVDDQGNHLDGHWSACSSECPVEQGCQCHFPFKWNGIRHDACTVHDTPNGKPWCAIEVDDNGDATDAWAACSEDCPMEETAGVCMTTDGVRCQFPFKYIGITHDACTIHASAGATQPWCSTKVDEDGNHVLEHDEEGYDVHFGYCNQDCALEKGKQRKYDKRTQIGEFGVC